MQHLMVRVGSPSFDGWYKAFTDTNPEMANFGITGWHVYRDIDNSNAVMVHFMVDDMGKAMEFFRSPAFQAANKAAQVNEREFYIAEKKIAHNTNVIVGTQRAASAYILSFSRNLPCQMIDFRDNQLF